MGKDYYKILGVARDASDRDIARAYKKQALVWHPKISKEDESKALHHFCEVSESYEVLSCRKKRAFYDKYGEEKLKEGFFTEGVMKGGYQFKGNPFEIFESFFGTNNIFSALLNEDEGNTGSMLGFSFGAQNFKISKQPKDLNKIVECTLNEFYCGCSKMITYEKQVLNKDGITTSEGIFEKQIEIKPGYHDNQQITLEKEGDEVAGMIPSNLIITLKAKKHPQYRRKGDDLIYICHISLIDALCSAPLQITTLDGRNLTVAMNQIISQDTVRKVEGEGFPILADLTGKKGDLYITFKIKFPRVLSEDQRLQLKEILTE